MMAVLFYLVISILAAIIVGRFFAVAARDERVWRDYEERALDDEIWLVARDVAAYRCMRRKEDRDDDNEHC